MSTWTCKPVAAGLLALGLALAGGCDEAGAGFGGLPFAGASGPEPRSEAPLAGGEIVLVAPDGYCIDDRSLRPDFALIARCDAMGGRTRLASAPLALITVSVADGPAEGAVESLPTEPDTIVSNLQRDGLILLQIKGRPPIDSVSETYWRGLGEVGEHTLGLAVYSPQDAPALGETGAELLARTVRLSRSATAQTPRAPQPGTPAPRPGKKQPSDSFAALFQ